MKLTGLGHFTSFEGAACAIRKVQWVAVLIFAFPLLFCSGRVGAKEIRLRVLEVEAPKELKAYRQGVEDAIFSALYLDDGLEVDQENFSVSLEVNIKTMSYSMDAGLGELKVEVNLLTPQNERFFEGELWGTSGGKLGYKGSLQSLLGEAAQNAGERAAAMAARLLENPGQVTVVDAADEFYFHRSRDDFYDGQKVTVLRNNRLIAWGKIQRVQEANIRVKLTDGMRGVDAGDLVYPSEIIEVSSPSETGRENRVKRKKNFSTVLLGVLGVGVAAIALSKDNNKGSEPIPLTATTPTSVRLSTLNNVASIAPVGSGVAGLATATVNATPLNISNQTVTATLNWSASAGFVTPLGTNQATFTPPGMPQIVTVSARTGNGAVGTMQIHVGGEPKRFADNVNTLSFSVPARSTRRLIVRAYDNTLDPITGQKVLSPGNSTLRAELRTPTGLARRSTLQSVDETGALGTASPSINWKSRPDGTFEAIIFRDASEEFDNFSLELFNQTGEKLTVIGGGLNCTNRIQAGADYCIDP